MSDTMKLDDLRGRALYDALMKLKPADWSEGDWASRAGVNRGFFSDLKGKDIRPRIDSLHKLREVAAAHAPQPEGEADDDTVEIQHISLAWGLGASFTDDPVDVEMLRYPRQWIQTITHSPPELLTWARARGDSMRPTIEDGDIVLLDRSQTDVRERDALWAFTTGDVASIKRLRVKGDRFQIFSDNPNVPPDEEPMDFVRIVARVVFVGRRI